jgi:hypothetical protein
MELLRNPRARILLGSALGLAGAEGFFGVFSDLFDNGTQVGDAVGHVVGLPLSFAIFVAVMAAVLRPARRSVITWLATTAVLGTFAYFAGYAVLGPPADFALSIIVVGVIFGFVHCSVLGIEALRARGGARLRRRLATRLAPSPALASS